MDKQFKIVLVGNKGVGKSTFLKRHRTGEFDPKYIATMGVDVTPLTFHTTEGDIIFKVWDCAGDPNFRGLGDAYYQQAHGAICMYDLTSESTSHSIPMWIIQLRSAIPNIPTVVCGNKIDLAKNENYTTFSFPNSSVKCFPTSAYNRFNFEKPFLELARLILKSPSLEFFNAPPLAPPTIYINPSEKKPQSEKIESHWITCPGWRIKVTHEFFRDDSI